MSTENAKIKVRNRTVEIKWVSEFCDHIMSNYITRNKDHDLTFLQISKLMKNCDKFEQHRGRTWFAFSVINNVKYKVIFILTAKFAVVKTCYRHGY
jgi:hypothetical protein